MSAERDGIYEGTYRSKKNIVESSLIGLVLSREVEVSKKNRCWAPPNATLFRNVHLVQLFDHWVANKVIEFLKYKT